MPFKLNISEKEKSWKLELTDESLVGKSLGDTIEGKDISTDLEGYQLKITGGSDMAGFPLSKDVEGLGLKGLLLKKGWGMHRKEEGLRLRKTARGKVISTAVVQINMTVVKAGKKPLVDVFPDQNKAPEVKQAEAPAPAPAA